MRTQEEKDIKNNLLQKEKIQNKEDADFVKVEQPVTPTPPAPVEYTHPENVATNTVDNAPVAALVTTPPPVISAPPVQQSSTADQLIQKLYSTREAAPVFDQAKADRLVRMGRINQVGRGIGVLGDILTMSLGGNVRRRQPDTVAPSLYASYSSLMDKTKADQDSYTHRSFQKDMDNIRMGIGEEHRKTAEKIAADNLKSANAYRDAKDKELARRYDLGEITKKEQNELTAQYRKDNLRLGIARLNKPTAAEDKLTRPITIRNNAGTFTLKPEDADFLKGKALQNPELIKRYPTWFTKTEELDASGDPTGNYVTKLDSRIKDTDLIREQMNIEAETKTGPKKNVNAVDGPFLSEPAVVPAPKTAAALSQKDIYDKMPSGTKYIFKGQQYTKP